MLLSNTNNSWTLCNRLRCTNTIKYQRIPNRNFLLPSKSHIFPSYSLILNNTQSGPFFVEWKGLHFDLANTDHDAESRDLSSWVRDNVSEPVVRFTSTTQNIKNESVAQLNRWRDQSELYGISWTNHIFTKTKATVQLN